MSNNRTDMLVSDILTRIRDAITELDVTYEEYQAAKQWIIDVGEAGEWPLFLDVFVERSVERNAEKKRGGTAGTILGPYYLPDAPVLSTPFELPRRDDEPGDRLRISGRIIGTNGQPLAGAELDIWQSDAQGLYSGFDPSLPEGIFRGKVITDEEGHYEVGTVLPGPYTIPTNGPSGVLCAAAGWSPWRPAHIHMIVRADGYEELITQIFFKNDEYLANDVAGAVKEDLVVSPEKKDDGTLGFEYDFELAPVAVGSAT